MQSNPAKIDWSQLKSGKGIASMILIAVIVVWLAHALHSVSTPSATDPASASSTAATAQEDRAAAEKELSEVMALAKKGELVTSYKLSKTEAVVYAGPSWYFQSVEFKKDFLGKIGTLKKIISGYHHFEVRDALSNKMVGEVTALGSLEVYQ